MTDDPPSPCTQVCRIEGDLCAGCARTLEEIALWSGMDAAAKRKVWDRIRARRA
jgi:predicted Fe-S protein YdhL (DUF1289 family)